VRRRVGVGAARRRLSERVERLRFFFNFSTPESYSPRSTRHLFHARAHHLDPRGEGDADGAPSARRRASFATTTTTSDERRATERIDGDAVPEVRDDDDDDDDDGQRTNRIESNRSPRVESIERSKRR